MSGIRLETSGDMEIVQGLISLTTGVDATKQRLKQRLGLFLAEWFLDKTRGIPYISQVFVKNPNPVVIDSIFKREIITDPAVVELQEFDLDLQEDIRLLTVSFRAKTTEGPINFSEVFGI